MSRADAITDQEISTVLTAYAGMVQRVLDNSERWLGMDEDPPPSAPVPVRALDAIRDRAFGEKTPASPSWRQEPVEKRINWWVTRIGVSAGLAAAAPRFFGVLANRVPVQGALGAAAAGLAVCATAREHGTNAPAEWVPLLGRVLFDRELDVPASVPDAEESEHRLGDIGDDHDENEKGSGGLSDGSRRAARTLWALTRAMLGVGDLLDHRPRGGRLVRLLGQIPVVGVASGWFDERSGIRRAAEETTRLIEAAPPVS